MKYIEDTNGVYLYKNIRYAKNVYNDEGYWWFWNSYNWIKVDNKTNIQLEKLYKISFRKEKLKNILK